MLKKVIQNFVILHKINETNQNLKENLFKIKSKFWKNHHWDYKNEYHMLNTIQSIVSSNPCKKKLKLISNFKIESLQDLISILKFKIEKKIRLINYRV